MSLKANNIKTNKTESNTPILAAGVYPARVVQVIDLGLQAQRPWKGETKPNVNKIRVTYELPDEFLLDKEGEELKDKPRWISENMNLYPMSQDRATCTKRIEALDPTGELQGDWSRVLGLPCYVQVIHSKPNKEGKIYANVGSLTAVPKGVSIGDLVNTPTLYDKENPDKEVYDTLPDFIKELIDKVLTPARQAKTAIYKKPVRIASGQIDDMIEDDGAPY